MTENEDWDFVAPPDEEYPEGLFFIIGAVVAIVGVAIFLFSVWKSA